MTHFIRSSRKSSFRSLPSSKRPARWILYFLYLLAMAIPPTMLAGCGKSLEKASEAKPTALVERDPMEDSSRWNPSRWPVFRGYKSQGIAPSGSPPVNFGPEEGVLWKTQVPGEGYSSPVVWDDRLFLTTALETTDPPTVTVMCYDRHNGDLLWKDEISKAEGRTHVKNGYASASPVVDGERVYTFFGPTGLFCHDFSGKHLWWADLGRIRHMWGFASSPILHEDKVIQLCDSQSISYLAAFDKLTGEELWRTDRTSKGCWTTPVMVEATTDGGKKRTEVVVNGGGGASGKMRSYDPDTGKELWSCGSTSEWTTPTALIFEDNVLSSSGRNDNVFSVHTGGTGKVEDTHRNWLRFDAGPYIPTPVLYRSRLFIVNDAKYVTCYDPGNGEKLWRGPLSGAFTASPVAADGRIYAVNERGTVFVFRAEDSFELLAENRLHERTYATPLVVDGDLLIRTETMLYCFDGDPGPASDEAPLEVEETQPEEIEAEQKPDEETSPTNTEPETPEQEPSGSDSEEEAEAPTPPAKTTPIHEADSSKLRATADSWPLFRGDPKATGHSPTGIPEKLDLIWKFTSLDGWFEAAPVIADGTIYVGSSNGNLYALGLDDGKEKWRYATESSLLAPAAVKEGRVFLGDLDGTFHCVEAEAGERLWTFQAQAEINNSPNFFGHYLIFGSQDGFLYCLDDRTGELQWKYESDDQIRCFPTIVGDRTFVAGCDGKLHILNLENGSKEAHVEFGAPTGSTPAVLGDSVYFGTEGNQFLAIDWKEHAVRWEFVSPRRQQFRGAAAVAEDGIFVGCFDKTFYCLDPENGEILWSYLTKGRIESSPILDEAHLCFGSDDGNLYLLDRKTGEPVDRFQTGGKLVASPAVASGRIVIGGDDGILYCFGQK